MRIKNFLQKLLLFCVLLSLMLFCGCRSDGENAAEDGKIQVVCTIFPPYDFARQIGGEQIDLHMLLDPGVETHAYSPSPQDIILIENCDVFLYGGGGSDTWLDDLLDSIDLSDKQMVRMIDCVETLEIDHAEGVEDDHSHDHSGPDEHVWTSPRNAILISQAIGEALAAADTEHAQLYEENAAAYCRELETLDADFRQVVENGARKTLIFGDRFPLLYFVEEYGLDYYAAFIGCSSETEPSAATVAFLIDKLQEEQIPIVFQLELSNGNIAQAIAADAGAEVRTFQSCHNLSKEDFEAGASYISLMRENLSVLEEALNE